MSHQQSISILKSMKLSGMCFAFEEQLSQPNTYEDLSFEERVAMLIDREQLYRQNSRLQRLIKQAKFKVAAVPEDIDYQHPRGLFKDKVATLLTGGWIKRHQNLLITGANRLW